MTYAELKNLIQNYLQNTETSFTTYLPDMIKQAEDRILENVQLPVRQILDTQWNCTIFIDLHRLPQALILNRHGFRQMHHQPYCMRV
jgi:cell fate regulator YaaT (PSP1 superfamily)